MLSVCSLSCVDSFATPWSVARQVPLSIGFSRQEYWSGLPFPPPGDLPDPGIKPGSPALVGKVLPLSHQGRHLSVYTRLCTQHMSHVIIQ